MKDGWRSIIIGAIRSKSSTVALPIPALIYSLAVDRLREPRPFGDAVTYDNDRAVRLRHLGTDDEFAIKQMMAVFIAGYLAKSPTHSLKFRK